MFEGFLRESILGRAAKKGICEIKQKITARKTAASIRVDLKKLKQKKNAT